MLLLHHRIRRKGQDAFLDGYMTVRAPYGFTFEEAPEIDLFRVEGLGFRFRVVGIDPHQYSILMSVIISTGTSTGGRSITRVFFAFRIMNPMMI